jgi:hypothetical protein
MNHLDQRIRNNKSGKVLSYDISEKHALDYAIRTLKACRDALEDDTISEDTRSQISKIMRAAAKDMT